MKTDRLPKIEEMIVVVIVVLRVVPVVDPEVILARDRHMVVGHRVEQADSAVLVRRAIGDQRGVDAVLLQIERQMQAGDFSADDSDVPSDIPPPPMLPGSCVLPLLRPA